MPIAREMLDWSNPALPQAAGWLARSYARAGRFDLGPVIITVPGAEAGRRLLELLVLESESQGWLFTPPEIVTPGSLPEQLYKPKRPMADELVQQLAWVSVLQNVDAAELKPLVHRAPPPDDLPAWLALARMLAHLHRELAADALDCRAILEHAREVESFNESERWELLCRLQDAYHRLLDKLELWDAQTARLMAVENRECKIDRPIVLVGVVDLNRSQREMLDRVAERVTSLVFAPPSLADRFDEHGCIIADAWQNAAPEIELNQIEIVDGPGDQADAVVQVLHEWNGRFAADEIVIGVPDPKIVPHLRQRLEEAGVPSRHAAGMPIERSGPYQLLAEAADFLERRRFRDLAVLVRHPGVARWLARDGIDCDWLTLFDKYYSSHLPAELDETSFADNRAAKEARFVQGRIQASLSSFTGKPKPLQEWASEILELLTTIYGGEPLDDTLPHDRSIIRACDAIQKILAEYRGLPPDITPSVAGAAALRMLLGQLDGEPIAPPANIAAIELLGWLELPWNDAAALIITGMNEGIVPKSRRGDLFLPDALRRRLRLEDNSRRFARDAYALSLLAAQRRPLKIIAGRRSAEGESLVPSRLLLACDDAALARRTRILLAPPKPRERVLLPGSLRPGQPEASNLPIPQPETLVAALESLRVTELREYLACPYRYYLKRRLKLEALSDWADELDGASFGTLLHDVLKQFSHSSVADSLSDEKINGELCLTLGQLAAERFGAQPLPAVKLQLAMLQMRLEKFAKLQANWRRDGWKTVDVEREFKVGDVLFEADDGPISLIGRIDRIDRNDRTGELAVLDYKSSDSGKSPDQVHRQGRGAGKEWIDFQLPLYRHFARSIDPEITVRLGYVLLPKAIEKAKFELAEWTADDLDAADAAARAVIRGIRSGVFWPPTDPPPNLFGEFAAICQDDQFVAAILSAETSEESA